MMFQHSQICSSTSVSAPTTSESSSRANKSACGGVGSSRELVFTTTTTTTTATANVASSLAEARITSEMPIANSNPIGRLVIAITTLRFSSRSTLKPACKPEIKAQSSRAADRLKFWALLACYYIIGFTTILLITLHLNHNNVHRADDQAATKAIDAQHQRYMSDIGQRLVANRPPVDSGEKFVDSSSYPTRSKHIIIANELLGSDANNQRPPDGVARLRMAAPPSPSGALPAERQLRVKRSAVPFQAAPSARADSSTAAIRGRIGDQVRINQLLMAFFKPQEGGSRFFSINANRRADLAPADEPSSLQAARAETGLQRPPAIGGLASSRLERSQTRPPSQELTFRQAPSQSQPPLAHPPPSTRGHLSNNSYGRPPTTVVVAGAESQWIPFVGGLHKPGRLTVQVPAAMPAARSNPKPPQPRSHVPPTYDIIEPDYYTHTASESFDLGPRARPLIYPAGSLPSLYHQGPSYHSYRQTASSADPYQWRRPKLSANALPSPARQRMNKLYKRVLLCDKTLVSLDYVRNFDLRSEPPGLLDEFDDTSNDILYHEPANQVDVVNPSRPDNGGRRVWSLGNSTSDGFDVQPSGLVTDRVVGGDIPERRTFLPDDEPLVKCDMWDLEKGLKNRKPPKWILDKAVKADFDTVRDAINRCRRLSEKNLPPEDEYRDGIEIMSTEDMVSLFSMKRGLMPGTKWCGLGDQASSYNDLGPKHRIDICCRAHDHCPIRLKPFRNDYGVLNIALYTKSHCDCDADFYRCLREAHSKTADMLGNLYFNVMRLQCMREERMKVCREMKILLIRPIGLGFERCIKYEESPIRTVFKFTTPPVAY